MQGALVAGFDVPGGMFLRWVPLRNWVNLAYSLKPLNKHTDNSQHDTGQTVQRNVRSYVETTTNALDGPKSCQTTFATSRPVEIMKMRIQSGSTALPAQVFLYLSVLLEEASVPAKWMSHSDFLDC